MREFALAYNQTEFDEDTKRQLGKILYIGSAALEDPADIEEVQMGLTTIGPTNKREHPRTRANTREHTRTSAN